MFHIISANFKVCKSSDARELTSIEQMFQLQLKASWISVSVRQTQLIRSTLLNMVFPIVSAYYFKQYKNTINHYGISFLLPFPSTFSVVYSGAQHSMHTQTKVCQI